MSQQSYFYRLGAKIQDMEASMNGSFSAKYATKLAELNAEHQRLMTKAQTAANAQYTSHTEDYKDVTTGEDAVANAMYSTAEASLDDLFAEGGSEAVTIGAQISAEGGTLVTLLNTKQAEIIANINEFATETGTPADFTAQFNSEFETVA